MLFSKIIAVRSKIHTVMQCV